MSRSPDHRRRRSPSAPGEPGIIFAIASVLVLPGCSLWIGDIPGPLADADAGEVPDPPPFDAGTGLSDSGSAPPSTSPDASEAPDTGPSDTASATPAAPSVATDSPADAAPAPTLPTSTEPDGGASLDSGTRAPDDDANVGNCDADGDGATGEACGGDDCDDEDAEVYPGQERYFTEASERRGFDYDCDGIISRPPSEVQLSCALELAQCDTELQGFFGDALPPCGELGDWGGCVVEEIVGGIPGSCAERKDEERRAACR
jgi:hypothetical protein